MRCMSCSQFVDPDAQRLLSGGNDRQLYLWHTSSRNSAAGSSSPEAPVIVAQWRHKRKINAFALHADHMYVADTSKLISMYRFS